MEPCIGYFINGGKPVLNGIAQFDAINRTINQAGGFKCLQTMPAGNYSIATFTHSASTAIAQSGCGAAVLCNPGAALIMGCLLGICLFAAYTYLNRPQTNIVEPDVVVKKRLKNYEFHDTIYRNAETYRRTPRKAREDSPFGYYNPKIIDRE